MERLDGLTEESIEKKTIPSCDNIAQNKEDNLRSLFMQTANDFIQIADPGKQFQIDSENRDIISGLWNYFLGIPDKYSPNKGIWLIGPPGTGKSALLYIFSSFMRKLRHGFNVYTANDVALQFEQNGNLNRFTSSLVDFSGNPIPIAIDEIGQEPRPSVYFGTKRNVIQYVLHTRYSHWQRTGLKTFATTNLDMNDIEEYYGDAIRDRIPHMFNIIPLDGESRRR